MRPWLVVLAPSSSNIVSYGGTNEVFQRRLINCVAFMEIYSARLFRTKAGVEECMWIIQRSTLKKVQLYDLLECARGTNESLLRPDRRIPLPLLRNIGGGLVNKFSQSSDHFAMPVGKLCDVCVDTFRWIHVFPPC